MVARKRLPSALRLLSELADLALEADVPAAAAAADELTARRRRRARPGTHVADAEVAVKAL